MDWSIGPAELAGIITSVALGAWSLGRWQRATVAERLGAPAVSTPPASPGPALALAQSIPCQLAARAERRRALAAAEPLAQLHARMSAYRRAEQVLADSGGDVLWVSGPERAACRYVGLTGEPTCGIARSAHAICAGATCSAAPSLNGPPS